MPARPRWLRAAPASIAVLVATLGMTGCTGAAEPDESAGSAEVVADYDCQAPNLFTPYEPSPVPTPGPMERPDAPAAGSIPPRFEPVAAYLCDLSGTVEDEQGIWSGVTVSVFGGDLTALVEALAVSDDAPSTGACTADLEYVPALWLADASGAAILAHWPVTGCGKTKPGVATALLKLDQTEEFVLPRVLSEPRAALDAGCAAAGTPPAIANIIGMPEDFYSVDQLIGATALAWCRYTVEVGIAVGGTATDPLESYFTADGGTFAAGGTVQGDIAVQVIEAVNAPPTRSVCDSGPNQFVMLAHAGASMNYTNTVSVWLEGCEVGAVPELRPPALLPQFTPLFG